MNACADIGTRGKGFDTGALVKGITTLGSSRAPKARQGTLHALQCRGRGRARMISWLVNVPSTVVAIVASGATVVNGNTMFLVLAPCTGIQGGTIGLFLDWIALFWFVVAVAIVTWAFIVLVSTFVIRTTPGTVIHSGTIVCSGQLIALFRDFRFVVTTGTTHIFTSALFIVYSSTTAPIASLHSCAIGFGQDSITLFVVGWFLVPATTSRVFSRTRLVLVPTRCLAVAPLARIGCVGAIGLGDPLLAIHFWLGAVVVVAVVVAIVIGISIASFMVFVTAIVTHPTGVATPRTILRGSTIGLFLNGSTILVGYKDIDRETGIGICTGRHDPDTNTRVGAPQTFLFIVALLCCFCVGGVAILVVVVAAGRLGRAFAILLGLQRMAGPLCRYARNGDECHDQKEAQPSREHATRLCHGRSRCCHFALCVCMLRFVVGRRRRHLFTMAKELYRSMCEK